MMHFNAVRITIDSSKIKDVRVHYDQWHIPQYWEMSKDILVQNGFE